MRRRPRAIALSAEDRATLNASTRNGRTVQRIARREQEAVLYGQRFYARIEFERRAAARGSTTLMSSARRQPKRLLLRCHDVF